MKEYLYKTKGFTYIELLIVVGVMIIFGVFFVVAVDPVGKIKAQRDSQRESDLNSILLSVQQKVKNDRGWNCPSGPLPQDKFTAIGTGPGEYDLYDCLKPNYLSKYLVDPKEGSISGSNITDGLVGHWKFDEGSGTTAYDASGNENHGTLFNGPTWVDGKMGEALDFDGDNDYIDLGDVKIPSNLTEVSLGAWVKTPISSGHHRVFSKEGVLYVGIYGENISFYSGSGSNWIDIWTGGNFGTISENEWTHITWVKNGTTYKAYKNGNLTGTETGSLDTLGDNTENDVFGQVLPGSTTQSWEGLIDDVRIYNRALSAEEIQDLYNYEYSSKYTIWQNPVTKNISLKSTEDETKEVSTGAPEIALNFDGTNDYANIPNDSAWDFGTNNLSVGFWFKSEISNKRMHALNFGSSYSANNISFNFNNEPYGVWVYWMGGGTNRITTTENYNDGEWHYLFFSRNGSNANLFIDNSFIGSRVDSTSIDIVGPLRVGGIDIYFWDGLIDDVRIYNRALSAEEVEQLYKGYDIRNGLVGHWPLNEGQGETAYDRSGNDNHGTLLPVGDGPTWTTK
ncbi:MAG: LamG domain-containing protein [Candidatus Pacebacteria bacterium]|nr:LamG domain-containing protein [Candidatus Paceibacterota bacterium]